MEALVAAPRLKPGALELFRAACRPRVAYGVLAFAAVGYSVVAFELSLAHARPMPDPYLRIADADYFFWGGFFYAPVIAAAWLLATGATYAISAAGRLRPSFEALMPATALATGIGTLGTLLPDLVTSPLRAAGVIDEAVWEASIANQSGWFYFTWTTLIVYLILFPVGYSFAVKAATSATWPRAIGAGLAGFVVFQGFEYLFIR